MIELIEYLKETILPQYDSYDKGHNRDHIEQVAAAALELSSEREVNIEMVLTAAYFHDLGLCEGRATHHLSSARMLCEDEFICSHFSPEDVEIIAQAIEDHRASAATAPRSIYGEILSSADRIIVPETIIMRSFYHSEKYHSDNNFEDHVTRIYQHIYNKYGENGYLRVPILTERNKKNLFLLREMLVDENKFKNYCVEVLAKNGIKNL